MSNSVNISNELMAKLLLKSSETGLNVDDLVAEILSCNLDSDDAIIDIRDISYGQMRKEIVDYMQKHEVSDALEISESLKFDIFEVNEIMAQLIKEGILKEV